MPQTVFKRTEIKYLVSDAQRQRLEDAMVGRMAPDAHGPSTVRNVYLDTPTHLLARRSMDHPPYKEKLRVRRYGDPVPGTDVFLELKKKCEGVVYKRRATLSPERARCLVAGTVEPRGQIERELAFSLARYQGICPQMYLAYDREAFYDPCDHEFRMTFDRGVRCRWNDVSLDGPDEGLALLPEGVSILEVKAGLGMPLWLADLLARERIYKSSFSKYGQAWLAQQRVEGTMAGWRPAPTSATAPTPAASLDERLWAPKVAPRLIGALTGNALATVRR